MVQGQFPARTCPVCDGISRTPLFQQSFERLSNARLLDGYTVVTCDECGAGFADKIPAQSAFDAYYRDLSKYDNLNQDRITPQDIEPRLRNIAAELAPFIPNQSSRIFEIGCASGGLLAAIRQAGFPNVSGADPSPECGYTAKVLYGISVAECTIFNVPKAREPYDFLILTGVIEHIRDLDRAVACLSELISPVGRVYLEVPDASRLEPSLDAPFQEFSPEHINFFGPRSLNNLMCERGFRFVAGCRMMRPLHEAACPTVYGIYEKANRSSFERDYETELGLRSYIRGCQKQDERLRGKLESAVSAGERLIVWGVGTHTLRLLATGGLDPSHIEVFVDSNPKYQNQHLRGIPVVSPQEVRARTEPILISSRGFQKEIQHQIRNSLGMQNPLILLYEV